MTYYDNKYLKAYENPTYKLQQAGRLQHPHKFTR